jgi:hypothetical protein
MMKWRHSVTFKLFAVTFAVIMLLLGGVLAVLAGTFSSFYERRQAHDIAYDLNRIRDRYVQEAEPGIDGFDRIPRRCRFRFRCRTSSPCLCRSRLPSSSWIS